MKKKHWGIVILTLALFGVAYQGLRPRAPAPAGEPLAPSAARVTFVELGSVNCIPCRAMQPVMRALEQRYGEQIRIVFYDVWQDDRPAREYGIRAIPTQVFLDESGREFHRHEGFYPLDQIVALLERRGLVPREP